MTRITAYYLQQKFGDEVGVEYFDVADPDTRKQVTGILDEIAQRRLRMPVVAIDGVFIEGGRIDYWEIAQVVGRKIETQKQTS